MSTVKKKVKSARGILLDFVSDLVSSDKTDVQIKSAVVSTFSSDPAMVTAALEFFASWALSDSQAISRQRAVRSVLSTTSPTSVFDALEEYLEPVANGRLLSILDMTKVQILDYVAERREVIEGELTHINCIEEIAEWLPSDRSTPRSFFASNSKSVALQSIIASYYG